MLKKRLEKHRFADSQDGLIEIEPNAALIRDSELWAEIENIKGEIAGIKAGDVEKTRAETLKAKAEAAKAAIEAVDKLATVLIKLSCVATILLGGIKISNHFGEPDAQHISVTTITGEESMRKLQEYIRTLQTQQHSDELIVITNSPHKSELGDAADQP